MNQVLLVKSGALVNYRVSVYKVEIAPNVVLIVHKEFYQLYQREWISLEDTPKG